MLDERYNIAVREVCTVLLLPIILSGPSARHGPFQLRVFNRLDEVKSCIRALEEISGD